PCRAPGRLVVPLSKGIPTRAMSTCSGRTIGRRIKVDGPAKRGTRPESSGWKSAVLKSCFLPMYLVGAKKQFSVIGTRRRDERVTTTPADRPFSLPGRTEPPQAVGLQEHWLCRWAYQNPATLPLSRNQQILRVQRCAPHG